MSHLKKQKVTVKLSSFFFFFPPIPVFLVCKSLGDTEQTHGPVRSMRAIGRYAIRALTNNNKKMKLAFYFTIKELQSLKLI